MQKFRTTRLHCAIVTAVAAASLMVSGPAPAAVFVGDLFYTTFAGGQNVFKVTYSYDDASKVFGLGAPTNIAALPGADGIIFGTNGNLLIGGANSGNVYEVSPTTGAIIASQATGAPSFHLALDPSATMPQELTPCALDVALGWRDPDAGPVHHSDRGSQVRGQ